MRSNESALVCLGLLFALGAGNARAADAAEPTAGAAKPIYGTWGYDLAGADPSVDAGSNFFRRANGKWLDRVQIPPDKPAVTQVVTDPHSPRQFRVIGPTRNIDAWYDAFGVKPGDAMFIAPERRVRIW